ncbi:MAG TPA: nickel pincer cofactor biosynthesis protein LarB [Acidimicrobiales bacterium]|nr:nickel pincer cofactor biosynthesis protein LarB [Acidimicrobiales bacterium]
MDRDDLTSLLDAVSTGAVAPDDAATRLRRLPFADLGYARVDHHRAVRQGLPEAVYGPGKTPEECAGIVAELLENGSGPVLLTRADAAQADAALSRSPGGYRDPETAEHGRPTIVCWRDAPRRAGAVVVVTAGTADLPVARECVATLRAYGFAPSMLVDRGVAGLHRLLVSVDEIAGADAVVVVAGMEGALASVVGGVTAAPVVAVPTSVGYGASFAGLTALLAMLSSCAAGVTVVGIDNGFGAACAIARILA